MEVVLHEITRRSLSLVKMFPSCALDGAPATRRRKMRRSLARSSRGTNTSHGQCPTVSAAESPVTASPAGVTHVLPRLAERVLLPGRNVWQLALLEAFSSVNPLVVLPRA